MLPDDPRHGTPAGAMAHWRAGQPACDPCRTAKARDMKRRRLHGTSLVPLTPQAWAVVRDNPLPLVARTTGVSNCSLRNIRAKSGDLAVSPLTLARLHRFAPVTDEGIRRRARALAAIGWSSRQIGEAAGVHHDAILKLQRPTERAYISSRTRDGVLAAYEALAMTPAPPSRWATHATNQARLNLWAPPMAWDDIDTDARHAPGSLRPISKGAAA